MPSVASLTQTINSSGGMIGAAASAALTRANTALQQIAAGASAGPSGAVQFSDGSGHFLADDANFHFNNATNRLGLGNNTPTQTLDVTGGMNQSGGVFTLSGSVSSSIACVDTLSINASGVSGLIDISTNSILRASFDENEGDPLFSVFERSEFTTSAANFTAKFTNESGTAAGGGLLIAAGGAAGAVLLRISGGATQLVNVNQISGTAVDILPGADNVSNIGSNGLRWALVRATVVTTGDLNLVDEKENAHWVIKERRDKIIAYNKILDKEYEIALIPR